MSDETSEPDMETLTRDDEDARDVEEGGCEFEALTREIEQNPGSPSFPRLAEAYRRDGQVERAETIAKEGLSQAPERLSGRVALALAMLDKGEIIQATQELSSIMENIPEVPCDASEIVSAEHRIYSEPPAAEFETAADHDDRPEEALEVTADDPSYAHLAPLCEDREGENSEGEAPEEGAEDNTGQALQQAEIDDAFASARTEADQMVSANQLAEAAMRNVGEPEGVYSASEHPVFATETMAGLLEGQGDREGAERVRASLPLSTPILTYAQTDPAAPAVVAAAETGGEVATVPDLATPDHATPDPATAELETPNIAPPSPVASLPEAVPVSDEELVLHVELVSEITTDTENPMPSDAGTHPTVPETQASLESVPLPSDLNEEWGGAVSDLAAVRDAENTRVIQRLERWLANIRRDVA